MAQFPHILTSIPVGSKVMVYCCGRFVQFDEVMKSDSIAIIGSPECYPIKVTIRPSTYGHAYRGGFKVIKPMGSEWEIDDGVRGGTFDIVIKDVLEFNPGKLALYTPYAAKVGPFLTVAQVKAAPNPVTDVFNIWRCQGCAAEVPENTRYCEKCSVTDSQCPHLRLGAPSPMVCGNPMVEGYGACQEHLDYMGIKVTKRPPAKKRDVERKDRQRGEARSREVKIMVDDVFTGKSVATPAIETKVVIKAKRGPYRHTDEYYRKRGMPIPRDDDERQVALPLEA